MLPPKELEYLVALNNSMRKGKWNLGNAPSPYLRDLTLLAKNKEASGDVFAKRAVQCLATCKQDFQRVQIGEGTKPKSKIAILQIMALPKDELRQARKKSGGYDNIPGHFNYLDSQLVNSQYAKLHGYDYISEGANLNYPDRHKQFTKILATTKWLPHYDWLLHIDADAMITNFSTTLESLIQKYTNGSDEVNFIAAADRDYMNTGVFLIKNTPKAMRFLSTIWHSPKESWHYSEQGPINMITGFQDSFASMSKIGQLSKVGQKYLSHDLRYPSEYQNTTFGWGTNFWRLATNEDLNAFPEGSFVRGWKGTARHPRAHGAVQGWKPGNFVLHVAAFRASHCNVNAKLEVLKRTQCGIFHDKVFQLRASFPDEAMKQSESCCTFRKLIYPFQNDVTPDQIIKSLPSPDPMPVPKVTWNCKDSSEKGIKSICTGRYPDVTK